MDMNILLLYEKCYVIIPDLDWSLPLLGNKLKKFNFVHQTVSRREVHTS